MLKTCNRKIKNRKRELNQEQVKSSFTNITKNTENNWSDINVEKWVE